MLKENESKKVSWYSYLALIAGIIFFSGLLKDMEGPISAFDFTNLLGKFGALGEISEEAGTLASSFRGNGGTGVRDAWLFGLSLMPAVIFALGVVRVIENFGGLEAAQKLMNPLLKPLLGIPGTTGLALIASLQSTDAGAAMTKELYDTNMITESEQVIFSSFQYSAGGLITNFLSSGAGLFMFFDTPIFIPLGICLIFKFVAGNLARLYVNLILKNKGKEV